MTLNDIIELLKTSGHNTKGQVIWFLENATIENLLELRQSIDEKIRLKELENNNETNL